MNKTLLSEGIFNVCSSICRGCDLAVRIYEGCLAQWSFYFLVQIGGLQEIFSCKMVVFYIMDQT